MNFNYLRKMQNKENNNSKFRQIAKNSWKFYAKMT